MDGGQKKKYTVVFDVTKDPEVLPSKYNSSRGTKFRIARVCQRNLLEQERFSGRVQVVRKLSTDEKARVDQILTGGHPKLKKIIESPVHHVRFFYMDAYTLRESTWVNDRCIDYYLSMLESHVVSDFNIPFICFQHP